MFSIPQSPPPSCQETATNTTLFTYPIDAIDAIDAKHVPCTSGTAPGGCRVHNLLDTVCCATRWTRQVGDSRRLRRFELIMFERYGDKGKPGKLTQKTILIHHLEYCKLGQLKLQGST